MKRFTIWLVRHRVLVIILCLALVVPSIFGMAATKTKYDLLYYLPQDLETVQGQEILLEDFGKGAFSLLVTEGMSIREQSDMENAIKVVPMSILSSGTHPSQKVCFRWKSFRRISETASAEGTVC